jgi:hypothetical protein
MRKSALNPIKDFAIPQRYRPKFTAEIARPDYFIGGAARRLWFCSHRLTNRPDSRVLQALILAALAPPTAALSSSTKTSTISANRSNGRHRPPWNVR